MFAVADVYGSIAIGMLLLCLVLAIPIIWANKRHTDRDKRDLSRARRAYEDALYRFTQSPRDANLRVRALSLGRAFAIVSRESDERTEFDEVALMKDINAASPK